MTLEFAENGPNSFCTFHPFDLSLWPLAFMFQPHRTQKANLNSNPVELFSLHFGHLYFILAIFPIFGPFLHYFGYFCFHFA